MGVAGEMAARVSTRPGSFQIALLDALDEISASHIASLGRILTVIVIAGAAAVIAVVGIRAGSGILGGSKKKRRNRRR